MVRTPKGARPNKRTLIIELEPPGRRELKKAASFLISLHSAAYDWKAEDALSSESVEQLVEKFVRARDVPVYRPFLRALVEVLDAVEQGAGVEGAQGIISDLDFGTDGQEDSGEHTG